MPLIIEKHTKDGAIILVWEDKESLDHFYSNTIISSEEERLLAKYSNDRRKKDLIISRHLLQHIDKEAVIAYLESGKPYIEGNGAYLSISHSKDLVSIIYHPTKTVAIDIEYINKRVEKVKNRFLSEVEISDTKDTQDLTLYWSAKETLFKIDEKQGLDFRTEMTLTRDTNKILWGKIRNENEQKIHYKVYSGWVMTYAIKG